MARGTGGFRRPPSHQLVTGKGRTVSQQHWLARQLKDPYVAEAKRRGYRSRAAFKLIEIDDHLRLLKPGGRVVDLGAAPGGWTQVAVERVGAGGKGGGHVVALDLGDVAPIHGATIVKTDIHAPDAPALVKQALGGPADVVLSDLAPGATGHRETDHLRILGLVEAALALAVELLRPGGTFVAKLSQGGREAALEVEARRRFALVRRMKPAASRAESAEFYLVASGFKGVA